MIKLGRRGSVLVHVLITGVIVAVIAAGMLRMVMMNYIAVDRVQKNAQNRKEADAMLLRAITYWNKSGIVCSTTALFPCSPSYGTAPGTCNCSCPNNVAIPRVTVTGGGAPPCNIQVISSDPL